MKKLQAKRIKEKRACQVLNEEEVAVPFEARMQDILDRVSSIQLSVQKKRNIKRLACELSGNAPSLIFTSLHLFLPVA